IMAKRKVFLHPTTRKPITAKHLQQGKTTPLRQMEHHFLKYLKKRGYKSVSWDGVRAHYGQMKMKSINENLVRFQKKYGYDASGKRKK
ncbi:hypothetical protein KA005_30210, partial [bacterium]|nr:hypothetical protein [bacterium]